MYVCLDTQEAPKSLSLEAIESNSMESLISHQSENKMKDRSELREMFVNYVRHRGEPDGKTTESPTVSISAKSRKPSQSGGENKFVDLRIISELKMKIFF